MSVRYKLGFCTMVVIAMAPYRNRADFLVDGLNERITLICAIYGNRQALALCFACSVCEVTACKGACGGKPDSRSDASFASAQ